MWKSQTERITAEIARDWGDRLSRVEVVPSRESRARGVAVTAWDARTGKWFTWAMLRDWVAWKQRQGGRGG
jgi:hypothetical protein